MILFYTTKTEYGFMSNFWKANQEVDGRVYQTNEHYYQSMKSNNPITQEWLRKAPRAWDAMFAGRNIRPIDRTPDWEVVKFYIMKKGLTAKFSQNPDLREKLLATGDLPIHEDSPTDMIWGIKGEDMLGKLLMEVRTELK